MQEQKQGLLARLDRLGLVLQIVIGLVVGVAVGALVRGMAMDVPAGQTPPAAVDLTLELGKLLGGNYQDRKSVV